MIRRGRQSGLTLVEIMISVVLVAIACAFVFSIQVRMSTALHDQATVSEVQQTLRSASDLMVRDLRMAGYLAKLVAANNGGVQQIVGPVRVANGTAGAPDTITLLYADPSAASIVSTLTSSDAFTVAGGVSQVDTSAGFATGDVVLATHVIPTTQTSGGVTTVTSPPGTACILAITGVPDPTHLATDPGAGAPWNSAGNGHCVDASGNPNTVNMKTVWNDGYTQIMHAVYRSYRIKPGDARGVLQMSPTAGVLSDWQDLALGIVDLQVALRVYDPNGTVDQDGDGDPKRDWYSSDNMAALPAGSTVLEVSVTLLAKSTKEVRGVVLDKTPDLFQGDKLHNSIGDADGHSLNPPITDTSSMYYGDHVYRTYTTTMTLRNSGVSNSP